jgi:ribosomal protein S6
VFSRGFWYRQVLFERLIGVEGGEQSVSVRDPGNHRSATHRRGGRGASQSARGESEDSGRGGRQGREWGKRRLAYDLRKQREGTYAVIESSAEPSTIKEFERQLRLNEHVLRFLTTRVPVKKRVRGTPKAQPATVEESV